MKRDFQRALSVSSKKHQVYKAGVVRYYNYYISHQSFWDRNASLVTLYNFVRVNLL